MKIFFYITAIFTLVSCNNGEIEKLKKENELIREQSKITKSDSISIFNSILRNSNRKFAVKFLDSLKNVDIKKYNAIINEAQDREIFGENEFDEF